MFNEPHKNKFDLLEAKIADRFFFLSKTTPYRFFQKPKTLYVWINVWVREREERSILKNLTPHKEHLSGARTRAQRSILPSAIASGFWFYSCSHTACGALKIAPMSSPMLTPDEALLKAWWTGYSHFQNRTEVVSSFKVFKNQVLSDR